MIYIFLFMSFIITGCTSNQTINLDSNNDIMYDQAKLSLKQGQHYEVSHDYEIPTA